LREGERNNPGSDPGVLRGPRLSSRSVTPAGGERNNPGSDPGVLRGPRPRRRRAADQRGARASLAGRRARDRDAPRPRRDDAQGDPGSAPDAASTRNAHARPGRPGRPARLRDRDVRAAVAAAS